MSQTSPKIPRVLVLFADTGAGHRSAGEAIIEALNLEYHGQVETDMVDFFKNYAPPPLNMAGPTYPAMSNMRMLWKMGYEIIDGRRRSKFLFDMLWPYVKTATARLLEEHPCDMIVSVHSMVNNPVLRALDKPIPYLTVVTDMVSTPAHWYNPKADMIVVATQAAYDRGIKLGIPAEKMQIIGLPIADRYCHPTKDRAALRRQLGWPQNVPIILLIGGGEGMGPLERNAVAIDKTRLNALQVIVAGRNKKLMNKLEQRHWHTPPLVYGFTREMPAFMQAADFIVTKAGPGTISEAFVPGLPIIIYSRVPGQEEGNVTHVVDNGAGVWAPQPSDVVAALRNWLTHPAELRKARQASLSLARPESSRQIARLIAERLGLQPANQSQPVLAAEETPVP
ncbi:MAG TPA: glycosyltransferase [Anaerolineaceae bacterium]|nr:glycosyltransferase [Anaerolineaceae bacterium]